ncbi:AfsR/SARP family transcriptional regulator [Streptomyces inhibens]|uniref:AfsR/SARP family transcriptional regulator n=1 Tax=Streptomyces inhibens TaxID=2293571 RepID=UPI00402AB3A9
MRFSVLGPFRAWRGETELDLGPAQQRAMLAALVLQAGRTVSVDELVDSLWGEEPPTRSVGVLRTYASRLRRVLEADRSHPEVLVSARGGYLLRLPSSCLDVDRFQEQVTAAEQARAAGDTSGAETFLRKACAMWEGVPLAGLPGPLARMHRARLTEQRLAAVRVRLEVELELGRHDAIVGELTALVSEHPLQESLRELLMLALYRSGRKSEALGVFADVRQALANELGIDPGPQLRDLQQRILQGDPGLSAPLTSGSRKAGKQPGRTRIRPAQLPADITDFTGREETVRLLRTDLTADGAGMPLALVSGMGGVGKSALAVHVAQAVRDRFPDGQLYADLRGAGDSPADPAQVLASFLGSLGIAEAAIPEGIAERSALLRSRLADLRVLILLDDARDSAQIRPLLPGSSSCAVLVTSRAWLTGIPPSLLVKLEPWPYDEAVALLTRIVGDQRVAAEPSAARQIAEACGFLPLAVRTAASRLASRPAWRLSQLAGRLASERYRLATLEAGDLAVEASFRLSYEQLDEQSARAFRLLALPDGPDVSSAAAAALLQVPEHDAERLAEALTDLGLLSCPHPGRYRYHDLLRLFAGKLADEIDGPAAQHAALERLLRHYLATVAGLYRVIRPGYPFPDLVSPGVPERVFTDPLDGIDWVQAEIAAVLAVARQALREVGTSMPVLADLVLVLIQLVDLGKEMPALCALARRIAEAARAAGLPDCELRARYTLFWALRETFRTQEARAEAEHVVALCQRAGQDALLAPALVGLALTNVHHSPDEKVAAWCDEAVARAAALGNRSSQAFVEGMAAMVDIAIGRPEQARHRTERSLQVFRELGDFLGQIHMLYARAMALHGLGRLGEAYQDYEECLDALNALGSHDRIPGVMVALAQLHRAAGRPAQAVSVAEAALAAAKEVGLDQREARALKVLGQALCDLGQRDCGHAHLRNALAIFHRLGTAEAAQVQMLLAEEKVPGTGE